MFLLSKHEFTTGCATKGIRNSLLDEGFEMQLCIFQTILNVIVCFLFFCMYGIIIYLRKIFHECFFIIYGKQIRVNIKSCNTNLQQEQVKISPITKCIVLNYLRHRDCNNSFPKRAPKRSKGLLRSKFKKVLNLRDLLVEL